MGRGQGIVKTPTVRIRSLKSRKKLSLKEGRKAREAEEEDDEKVVLPRVTHRSGKE